MIKNTRESIKEIIIDFNREIELNPKLADAWCSRGILKFCINDLYGAFMDWSMAADLGHTDADLLIRYFLCSSKFSEVR